MVSCPDTSLPMNKTSSVRLLSLFGAIVLSAGLASCKKAADLTKNKEAVLALAKTNGPKLAELADKLKGLTSRADAIPSSVPGADKVKGLIKDHAGKLDSLKAMLGGLDAQVATAAKAGKPADVDAVGTKVTAEVTSGIAALTTGLAAAEVELATVEAAAKAPPVDAAGSGSGSAVDGAVAAVLDFVKKVGEVEIKGATDGIESKLIAFIEDAGNAKAIEEKKTWFSFDRLTFATGKAEIEMAKSKEQLDNIVAILKAFPTVKLKIGGYTDNTGPADANKKISGERASAVMKALVDAGIAADRLEAEGYGPEFPVCEANDTDDCKAKNRRIDLRVSAK
jgi:outer membrane protein OmpA-like peptidoglycan-associated protein